MNRLYKSATAALIASACALFGGVARASDHLDSPSVIADPSVDIGDVYAWTAPDGKRLNLAMTIVGHAFSDRATYALHIDSGRRFGRTSASVTLTCHFARQDDADCKLGDDSLRGDARREAGLESRRRTFRVFAGLRNDPFFNNVRGTRNAYQVAQRAIAGGAKADGAGCTALDASTSAALLDAWRHVDGGPPTNFLAKWTPMAIVVSVDLKAVTRGGPLAAVWGSTSVGEKQIDRAARPLTGNALLGTLAGDEVSDAMKEAWNAASPRDSERFVAQIAEGLALYDGFDGTCGNQFLAKPAPIDRHRYDALASLLADDRLWVNTKNRTCTRLFAVERAALGREHASAKDCGGRTLSYDSVNVYRSLLVDGTETSVDDGVHRDEHTHSDSVFPFIAAAE